MNLLVVQVALVGGRAVVVGVIGTVTVGEQSGSVGGFLGVGWWGVVPEADVFGGVG